MKRRGLTLFEVVVSLAIFSMALLVLGQLFQSYANWNSSLGNREEPLLQAREALNTMIAEAQGALAIAPNPSSLVLTLSDPSQTRFPPNATVWTPDQNSLTVRYQVVPQGLTRTQGSDPPLLMAERVEGMQVTLGADHGIEISLSVRAGHVLRRLTHNGFYWVKSL
ncbi:hypothetical protein ABS71_09330 [bacterium SCN 62-11]|nr:prepilin-type N-terminal cleavage/methylation domain-containing protein [Candidatus Eremiobacteraeota bacterium]ODT68985.1 MAG: hypothetical protein ABS71_09330 [bacterium SCN 62-11]